ncbi:MAG: PTS sugar transporter subunit IIA, partial [Verrucomicrobiae bacterium]|nr:PTS sugar transporter subunit IIA [Verrucomicrobiae bacterium]
MQSRLISLKEAAARLRLTERAVARLAQKGELRGIKDGATWSLEHESVEEWLQRQANSAKPVTAQTLSPEATGIPEAPTIQRAMSPLRMNFNLMAQDRDGVLRELTALVVPPAEKRLFNALFKALKAREDMCTTCVNEGIAIPHSRNAIVGLVDEPVIAYGRHRSGIEFGAFDGKPV